MEDRDAPPFAVRYGLFMGISSAFRGNLLSLGTLIIQVIKTIFSTKQPIFYG